MTLFIKNINGFSSGSLLASVRDGYNSFALDWNATRKNNWREFELLKSQIKKDSKILDLGCGNGRLYKYLKDITDVNYTGVDNSEELIKIARNNHPEAKFEVGDCLDLPYGDQSFDMVISIAVLHHITPVSNRKLFFNQIFRVLKPGGTAFITVWNIHQEKYKKYIKMNKIQKFIQTIKSPFNTSFGIKDTLIPYGEEKTLRYIHAFTPSEIRKLSSPNFEIVDEIYSNKDQSEENWKNARNLCYFLKKGG